MDIQTKQKTELFDRSGTKLANTSRLNLGGNNGSKVMREVTAKENSPDPIATP